MFSSLRNLLNPLSPIRRPVVRRPRQAKPMLESLEDRYCPSASLDTWTGGGGATNTAWMDAANWSSGVPVQGDNLVFPTVAPSAQTSTNNFSAGTKFGNITISGTGYNITGNDIVLQGNLSNTAGSNDFGLPLTLTAPEAITADQASGLTLSGSIDNGGHLLLMDAVGKITFNGSSITGAGGLTVEGGGSFLLENTVSNTYAGTTTLATVTPPTHTGDTGNSVLVLLDAATGAVAIPGNLDIGDQTPFNEAYVVRLENSDQIAATATVTAHESGLLSLDGNDNTIGPLIMGGGFVTTGASGMLTLTGGVTTVAGARTSVIEDNVTLGNGNTPQTFTVNSSAGCLGLNVLADITGGQNVQLIKAGVGMMQLGGNNTYDGRTVIEAGIVTLASATALGHAPYNGGAGTLVDAGATLQLQDLPGNAPYAIEPLMLNGAGVAGGGALQSLAGDITWSGPIDLASATTITAKAGSNLIDNVQVTTEGYVLTVNTLGTPALKNLAGVQFDTVNGSPTAGGITKIGAGTLTLIGPDFAGATDVNGGTLMLKGNGDIRGQGVTINKHGTITGSGTIDTSVIVNPGGTLAGAETINGSVHNSGVVSPGGVITINGSYTQVAGAQLDIELASKKSFDELVVNGDAAIAGALDETLINGFEPTSNDTFQFLTATNFSGRFHKVHLQQPDNGVVLAINYNSPDVSIDAN
jgi:fibronectin-binding autotransporter adhesin